MGLFTTPIKTLDDLFVQTLQDIYYAEKQIVRNLPEMIQKASNPDLRDAFQHHLTETENHVTRLEQVFQMLGQPAKGTDCPAMDGILSEAKDIISDRGDAQVCDAAMLSAAQAVEHYETRWRHSRRGDSAGQNGAIHTWEVSSRERGGCQAGTPGRWAHAGFPGDRSPPFSTPWPPWNRDPIRTSWRAP